MMEPGHAVLPYINSKISLISNADIRYEGILCNIDTLQSTVTLSNVTSFGTEGRRQPDIAMNNKTYERIIFKGKDIKDLTVCETGGRILEDPAIVMSMPMQVHSQSPPYGQQHQSQRYPVLPPSHQGNDFSNMSNYGREERSGYGHRNSGYRSPSYSGMPMGPMRPHFVHGRGSYNQGMGGRYNEEMYGINRHAMPPDTSQHGDMHGVPRSNSQSMNHRMSGRGGRGGGRRIVGELPAQPVQSVAKEMAVNFDFDEANSKFDKSAGLTANTDGEGDKLQEVTTGYDRGSSFFDTISCETLDRKYGQDVRMDRDKQKQLDCETFGPTAMSRGSRYRRLYRGSSSRRGYSGLGMRGGMRYAPMGNYPGYYDHSGNYGNMTRA